MFNNIKQVSLSFQNKIKYTLFQSVFKENCSLIKMQLKWPSHVHIIYLIETFKKFNSITLKKLSSDPTNNFTLAHLKTCATFDF